MTVEALLKQLKNECAGYHEDALVYSANATYHRNSGDYMMWLAYEKKRVDSLDKANDVRKVIHAIEKRVSK